MPNNNEVNASLPSRGSYNHSTSGSKSLFLGSGKCSDSKVINTKDSQVALVDRKVRALLNKLTMENYDSISNQIVAWANKSEDENDGKTLMHIVMLIFETARDVEMFSDLYARLCRKTMEKLSPAVRDESITLQDGKAIAGGQLFLKYLLNRCQEEFEHRWAVKKAIAAAAAKKAAEDQAFRAANEKEGNTEVALYSDEYYAAQKAKRRGLGLIKFIGELFKLQMLTERIMHTCLKKLLGNVDQPEEEDLESCCKLLMTIGSMLDSPKAANHMMAYFSRIMELRNSSLVSARVQFMLQDVLDLREKRWVSRNVVAAPSTIAQVHENAAKEKAAQEKDVHSRQISMSRGGSRRGGNRDDYPQVGPDGWAVAGGGGGNNAPRPPSKAGDLSNFGKINKPTSMSFGPSTVFAEKGGPISMSHGGSRRSGNRGYYPKVGPDGWAVAAPQPPPRNFMRKPSAMSVLPSWGLPQSTQSSSAPLHSHRPNITFKDGSATFGFIDNDPTPICLSPAAAPVLKAENIVKSFGSLPLIIPEPCPAGPPAKPANADIKKLFQLDPTQHQGPQVPTDDLSKKPRPSAPDLTKAISNDKVPVPPPAVFMAKSITNFDVISYPEGIQSPDHSLNHNAKGGLLRYDRPFLLQFMDYCKEKPGGLPDLATMGLEQRSLGSGISAFETSGQSMFPMMDIFGGGSSKPTSDNRFAAWNRTVSAGGSNSYSRPSPITQTSSQDAQPPPLQTATPTQAHVIAAPVHLPTHAHAHSASSPLPTPSTAFAPLNCSFKVVVQNPDGLDVEVDISSITKDSSTSPSVDNRDDYPQVIPDGQVVTNHGNAPRPPSKAGDLSVFGKINKLTSMSFGSNSVLTKKGGDSKHESIWSSSSNMLNQRGMSQAEPKVAKSESSEAWSVKVLTKEIEEDMKEFFAKRNLDDAETYLTNLPAAHHFRLIDKFTLRAIETQDDSQLLVEFFLRAVEKRLVTSEAFETGFLPIADIIDDVAIDVPKAFMYFATIVKSARLDNERKARLASKLLDERKLLDLLS